MSYRVHPRRRYAALSLALLTIIVLFSAVAPQVRADSIYQIPDTVFDSSRYAMTVNNGNPVLSYYSTSTENLMVAICGNPSCQTDLTVTHSFDFNFISDIAVTVVNGNPFIVYSTRSSPTYHLSIAACVDALCSQPPVMTTLDTGSFGRVAVTLQNGKALIVYENESPNGDHNVAKLAFCSNATCTAATIQPLSITDGLRGGYGIGIGLLNGNPIIAYKKENSFINLLKCLSPSCAETPGITTVDTAAPYAQIAMTVIANTPIITYTTYEYPVSWLKIATCTDSACNQPLYVHTVDKGYGDTSASLINGLPVIAYTATDGVRLATCLDAVCNYASSKLIAGSGHYLPFIQASQNEPVVSFLKYVSDQNALIEVYFGGDFHPSQSSTPSSTSTPTVFNPTSIALSATSTLTANPSTVTLSITPTASITLTPSTTYTPSMTYTPSITPTPSSTYTPSYTPTATSTETNTPTITLTPSATLITPTSAPNIAPQRNFYTTHTPTLTWNPVTWAIGYKIQISKDQNFAPASTFTNSLPVDALAYTTDSLANGTYYWRVMALGGTVSNWSLIGSFVISDPEPEVTP